MKKFQTGLLLYTKIFAILWMNTIQCPLSITVAVAQQCDT